MSITTTHAPGTFCWPELATTDQAGAEKFYSELFGWTMSKTPMGPDSHYTIFQKGENAVAAVATQDPEQTKAGIPSNWLSYVSTTNVDASVKKATELGGQVVAGPFDVMEHGRMAVLTDPTGAPFALWQANKHPGATALDEESTLVWTELLNDEVEKAGTFYSSLFGWKQEPWPGPTPYTVFKRGDAYAGGLMGKTSEMPPGVPNVWMVYFGVRDTLATIKKIEALGGTVIFGPKDIPNVGIMAVAKDPQGAAFCVMQSAEQPK